MIAAHGSGGFTGGRLSKAEVASRFSDPALDKMFKKAKKASKEADNKTNEVIAKAELPRRPFKYFKEQDETFADFQAGIMELLRTLVTTLVAAVFRQKAQLGKERRRSIPRVRMRAAMVIMVAWRCRAADPGVLCFRVVSVFRIPPLSSCAGVPRGGRW